MNDEQLKVEEDSGFCGYRLHATGFWRFSLNRAA